MNNPVKQKRPLKPELLAPAGSIECFHAALDAGADAVYLGVSDFNARLRAKNFTVQTLSYLVTYAHGLRKKIYVTLNILIKQCELEKAVHLLYQLEQIKVDGIIVQDLGIVEICRKYFPKIELHASTQMSLHNSLGVKAAQKLGIKRVVLARELTLKEIGAAGKNSPVELEVFVHGALCYCFSGMCMASSFLGGSSGNRGRCTQVCRRPFLASQSNGHYFSPSDFCALSFIEKYKEMGIASLKIEGRMKSADYVTTVVGMYRKALDDPKLIPDLMKKIDTDLGRNKTSFFLTGIQQDGIIDAHGPTGTGLFIGKISTVTDFDILIVGGERVAQGDLIRIQPQTGFEGNNVRIAKATKENGLLALQLKDRIPCAAGDLVYLTRLAPHPGETVKRHAPAQRPLFFKQFYGNSKTVLQNYYNKRGIQKHSEKPRLMVKIDNARWLPILESLDIDALIVSIEKREYEKLFVSNAWIDCWAKKTIIGFPSFIAESDCDDWRSTVRAAQKKGVNRALCQNLGNRELCDTTMKVFADAMLWCFNVAAQKALMQSGFSGFTYSWEDDYPNIASAFSPHAMSYIFAYIPVFISRIESAVSADQKLKDSFDNEFFTSVKHGLNYLVAKKPLCLFHKRSKLEDAGIKTFIIDLSFCEPDKQFYQDLMLHYKEGTKVPESSMFNFKAGIK